MRRTPLGLSAPFRWLADALALCRAHAALCLFASTALLTVVLLSAMVEQLVATWLPSPALVQTLVLLAVYVFFILLIKPVLEGGFYRLLHAVQQGQPVDRRQLFAVFDEPLAARRLVRTNLVFTLVLLLGVLMPVAAIGGEPLGAWVQAMSKLQPGATSFPPMPPGTGALLAVAMLLSLLVQTARALAMCQASLTARAPVQAAGDGARVTLAQAAAFLLFFLPAAVLAFVALLLVALLAVLLGAVLGLASPILGVIPVLVLGMLAVLAGYAVAFAFFYRAWRETLGDDDAAAPPAAGGPHAIEL